MSEEELKTQLKKEMISLCETNSSVMTYMECLMKGYEQLQNQLQQKESIIKEARKLLNQEWYSVLRKETITKVKEILDKENKC